MTFGIRALLLLVAAILFLIAAVSDLTSDTWPHLVGWGLVLTALALLVEDLPLGNMRWGTGGTRGGPTQRT
jgi:Flp pilus assembly protein protease CpaA